MTRKSSSGFRRAVILGLCVTVAAKGHASAHLYYPKTETRKKSFAQCLGILRDQRKEDLSSMLTLRPSTEHSWLSNTYRSDGITLTQRRMAEYHVTKSYVSVAINDDGSYSSSSGIHSTTYRCEGRVFIHEAETVDFPGESQPYPAISREDSDKGAILSREMATKALEAEAHADMRNSSNVP